MKSKKKWTSQDLEKLFTLRDSQNMTWSQLTEEFPGVTANALRKAYYNTMRAKTPPKELSAPKILILDIETTPIVSYTWGTFDQNIALNQIIEDWSILSWSAKWFNSDQVYYADTSNQRDPRDDRKLLQQIWTLLDEADIVVGQNSVSFDIKKLNARFILNGMKPPRSFRNIDTMRVAKKNFKFTSNKLEYLSKNLCSEHVKLTERKFNGFVLWSECLKGNKEAFKELKAYNIEDVLATEELLKVLLPWDRSINFDSYHSTNENICSCGSSEFRRTGFVYSNSGKYQRFNCRKCGKEHVSKENLHSRDKRKTLKK